MKRFVIVLTDKGGTGKSTLTRVLADYLQRKNETVCLVDGDGEVGQLFEFYCATDVSGKMLKQTATNGVLNVRVAGSSKERDGMLQLIDHGANTVLVDMPAASIQLLKKLDDETGFFAELQRAGYRPTLINVLTPYKASTRTVKLMIDHWNGQSDFVAVVNRWFGDDDDFFLWKGDGAGAPESKGRTLLKQIGGIEIDLPKVSSGVMVAVDAAMLKFKDATTSEKLTRAQRSRLRKWQTETDKEIAKIEHLLIGT